MPLISAVTGFGFLAISDQWLVQGVRRYLLPWLFPLALGRGPHKIVVENRDDAALMAHLTGIPDSAILTLKGAGVDLDRFSPPPPPSPSSPSFPKNPATATELPTLGVVARMLWSKGIDTAVEAWKRLNARGIPCRLLLAGGSDPDNPHAIPEATLRAWSELPGVRWIGRVEDIPRFWQDCAIAVLPSWREGLPKTLVEAAACGRPLVASDVPGCREIVRPGESGLLVPVRDPDALAEALALLITTPELRLRLGIGARRLVENGFSEVQIAETIKGTYAALLRIGNESRHLD
jgi:glycosyltransferase involved in cell wall biosynthesis